MPAAPYHTYSAEHSTVYTQNLAQASAPRLAMSCVVASTPSAGTYGTKGVAKPFLGWWWRGRLLNETVAAAAPPSATPRATSDEEKAANATHASVKHATRRNAGRRDFKLVSYGSSLAVSGVCRRTSKPAQTPAKMASVPMDTSCASVSMSTVSANKAVETPVNAEAFTGVPSLECTFPNQLGSSPSLAMAMYTRGCPISDESSAVVMAATAPNEMRLSAHGMPRSRNATAKGACTSISELGTMPVMTKDIKAYSVAQIPRLPKIPMGRSRPGSRVSSAHVATVSKPTNEKNTTDAPARTPSTPPGANGAQFSFSTASPPNVMTKKITSSDTAVTDALKRAVSFMPYASKAVTSATSAAAAGSSSTNDDAPLASSSTPRPIRILSASGEAWNSVAT